jgi:DUF1680 family protein
MSKRSTLNDVADWPAERAKCRPVPLRHVHATGFLGQRIDANLTSLLKGLDTPIPRGFEARVKGVELPPESSRLAADSDVYKWLEGASYVYARTANEDVREAINYIADQILACQQDDGYINTQVPPFDRFDKRVNHDLYIAGHFFEAAVAHHRATGENRLLEAACRWADYLIQEYEAGHPYFAVEPGEFPEHPEYELALLRLSREKEDKRYLDFAVALTKLSKLGPKVADVRAGRGLHAVRTGYLLAGCADLYLETGGEEFYEYLPDLWNEIVRTRMYVTGGVGVQERIPERPYFLPQSLDHHPDRDIAETCASVAMMMFAWRMHAITGESWCFDVIENILYNHYLGAIALDNLGNFYYNPLRVVGDQTGMTDHHSPKTKRCMMPAIHSTTCCLPNAWRFFGALPEYIFSYDERGIFVNLYNAGSVRHRLNNGKEIGLTIETSYPHDGAIIIRFDASEPVEFALRLRIPGWCRNAALESAGEPAQSPQPGQYFTVEREWKPGDSITLNLEMPVRMMQADPRIVDCAGQVVFARGPLVYCLDQYDTGFPVEQARVALNPGEIEVQWCADLLGGINVLRVPGFVARVAKDRQTYSDVGMDSEATHLTLIPFYARANRSEDNRWTTFLPLIPQS